MVEQQYLLIPITLRACLCGHAPSKTMYSGFQLNFTDLDDSDISIDNGLFVPGKSPEPGVHLAFTLPEGFTRGTQTETTVNGQSSYRLDYPPVPNRWSVIRMWQTESDSHIHQKTFLVESDALQTKRGANYHNVRSSSWPWPETPERPYRYLGRSYALSQAQSIPQDVERLGLTAISPVNPFFSAYYPHCRNVFGFYDNLAEEGITQAQVSYLVCGWYQDASEPDPVSTVTDVQELHDRLLMDWRGTGMPNRSLCHGLLCGIEWKGTEYTYPTGVPDDPQPGTVEDRPELALGNTSDEAAAALAEADTGISPRLFQCFLRNLCPDLLGQQGPAEVEKELNASGFSALQPPDLVCLSAIPGGEHKEPPTHSVMEQISDIRCRQRQLYTARVKHGQKQRAAYETWQLLYTGQGNPNTLYTKLQEAVTVIQEEQISLLKTAETLEQEIKSLCPGEGYELKTEPAAPFYQPAEPVLLVRQFADTEGKVTGGAVVCRSPERIITQVTFTGLGRNTVTVTADELQDMPLQLQNLPKAVASLVGEAMLLSVGFAPLIAQHALRKAGISPTSGQIADLAEQIKQVQQQFMVLPSVSLSGEFPEHRAVTVYKPKWYPLYLEWRCLYYPDKQLLQESPDLKSWSYKDGQYDYCGDSSILQAKNRYTISGRQLLSDNALRQLTNSGEHYLKELLFSDADLSSRTLLSQSLSGFNDMLLMRNQMVLLPQFSIQEPVKSSLSLLRQLSPEEMGAGAVFDELFSPIRGGFLAFDEIRILDKMGRFQDILSPDLYCGETMRSGQAPAKPHEAMLQPRLVQYTRLNAMWMCAEPSFLENAVFPEHTVFPEYAEVFRDAEASFVSTASPLCGFLLPNGLDNSLMAYTADGELIGSLVLTQTGSGIAFKSPPGTEVSPHIPTTINPQMYRMLHSLQIGARENLIDLLSYLNTLAEQIAPAPHGPSEVEFIGHPLALCRLHLKLEQLGEPEAYRHIDGARPDESSTTNVQNLVVPLEIGSQNDYRDGLAGFYLNGDFDHLHIYQESQPGDNAPGGSKNVRRDNDFRSGNDFWRDNCVWAALQSAEPPDELCVLMEPYAHLTIKSGLLPVHTMSLSSELINDALDRIVTSYFAGPLLSNELHLAIPAAYENDREYFFCQSRRVSTSHISEENESGRLVQTDTSAFSTPYPMQALEGYIQIRKNREANHVHTK